MERYIGLDAHGTSCTFGVVGPSGRKLRHDVVETNGAALVKYLRSFPGRKHLCLEEGTQSAGELPPGNSMIPRKSYSGNSCPSSRIAKPRDSI